MAILDIFKEPKNDGFKVPAGTTAQRPVEPSIIRHNTDIGKLEFTADGTTYNGVGQASGGGSDTVFVLNGNTINNAFTVPTGSNAHSVGPLTINALVTLNGRWVIS